MTRFAATTAAVAGMAWVAFALFFGPGTTTAVFASALDPVVQATQRVKATHLVLGMLTRPGEDFSYVNLEGEPTRVEVWIEWPSMPGDSGRVRIEKPDRIYTFDRERTIYYHPPRVEDVFHDESGGVGRLVFREKGAASDLLTGLRRWVFDGGI